MDSPLRWRALSALVLLVVFLTGCGGSGRLDGKVTIDGQPVDGGNITLVPDTTNGTRISSEITDGKYSFDSSKNVPPGNYKVEINWLKKTGKKIPNPNDTGTTVDERNQQIPMRYNAKTELSVEITSGSNTKDFDLKGGGIIAGGGPEKDSGKASKAGGADPDRSAPGRK